MVHRVIWQAIALSLIVVPAFSRPISGQSLNTATVDQIEALRKWSGNWKGKGYFWQVCGPGLDSESTLNISFDTFGQSLRIESLSKTDYYSDPDHVVLYLVELISYDNKSNSHNVRTYSTKSGRSTKLKFVSNDTLMWEFPDTWLGKKVINRYTIVFDGSECRYTYELGLNNGKRWDTMMELKLERQD